MSVGIRENTVQCLISGARVAFDPRSTREAHDKRDPTNYKAQEEGWRKRRWEEREREKRRVAA